MQHWRGCCKCWSQAASWSTARVGGFQMSPGAQKSRDFSISNLLEMMMKSQLIFFPSGFETRPHMQSCRIASSQYHIFLPWVNMYFTSLRAPPRVPKPLSAQVSHGDKWLFSCTKPPWAGGAADSMPHRSRIHLTGATSATGPRGPRDGLPATSMEDRRKDRPAPWRIHPDAGPEPARARDWESCNPVLHIHSNWCVCGLVFHQVKPTTGWKVCTRGIDTSGRFNKWCVWMFVQPPPEPSKIEIHGWYLYLPGEQKAVNIGLCEITKRPPKFDGPWWWAKPKPWGLDPAKQSAEFDIWCA